MFRNVKRVVRVKLSDLATGLREAARSCSRSEDLKFHLQATRAELTRLQCPVLRVDSGSLKADESAWIDKIATDDVSKALRVEAFCLARQINRFVEGLRLLSMY